MTGNVSKILSMSTQNMLNSILKLIIITYVKHLPRISMKKLMEKLDILFLQLCQADLIQSRFGLERLIVFQ